MAFLDLYRARTAMTVDKRQNDIINDFKYKGREFAVNNAYRDCRKSHLKIYADVFAYCVIQTEN